MSQHGRETGQGKTPKTRETDQSRTSRRSGVMGSPSTESKITGEKQIRPSERAWEFGAHESNLGSFIGGILVQSLGQLRERLRECDDCVVWYVESKQKILKQISEVETMIQAFEAQISSQEEE